MAKSDVNGDNTNDVFKYLKSQKSSLGMSRIKCKSARSVLPAD
jgi:glutathione peroxidase-family protein